MIKRGISIAAMAVLLVGAFPLISSAHSVPICESSSAVTATSYTLNGADGSFLQTIDRLRGNTDQGQSITAQFTLREECLNVKVSFVSYKAPDPYFSRSRAHMQQVHNSTTGMFTGMGMLTIKAPDCYYQVDLVVGEVKEQLGDPNDSRSNNFYGSEHRLVDADNDGDNECVFDGVNPLEGGIIADVVPPVIDAGSDLIADACILFDMLDPACLAFDNTIAPGGDIFF